MRYNYLLFLLIFPLIVTVCNAEEVKWLSSIEENSDFEAVSIQDTTRPDVARVTKFLVPVDDSPELLPALFQNVNLYLMHYDFLADVFPDRFPGLTYREYMDLVEKRSTRKYYAGTIYQFVSGGDKFYGFNVFTESTNFDELLEPAEIQYIYAKIGEGFNLEPLFFSPMTSKEIEKARGWVNPPFPVYFRWGQQPNYEAYTQGTAYGTVRLFTLETFKEAIEQGILSWQDTVVIEEAPSDIEAIVAGVITGTPQAELSHVNIRCSRRGTPNIYVKDALAALSAYAGKLVRLDAGEGSYEVSLVSDPKEAREWWDTHQPDLSSSVVEADVSDSGLVDIKDAEPDASKYGGKAANLIKLYKFLPEQYQVNGFVIPFAYYENLIDNYGLMNDRLYYGAGESLDELTPEAVSLSQFIQRMCSDDQFNTDSQYRQHILTDILQEYGFRKRYINEALRRQLRDKIIEVFGSDTAMVRFRSSSNIEDTLEFSGAGLYESKSVCAADSFDQGNGGPCLCEPARLDEETIQEGMRDVYRSLWNYRAFEERQYYQIPQEKAKMAILVTEAYPDEDANGVAFTGNPTKLGDKRYLINVQLGDKSVVRPEPGVIPEKDFLVMEAGEVKEIIRLRSSSLVAPGEWVLSDEQLRELGRVMAFIEKDFPVERKDYPAEQVLLDMEFKFINGQLKIKQIRPFLISSLTTQLPVQDLALDIEEGTKACGVFFEGRLMEDEYSLISQIEFISGTHNLPVRPGNFNLDLIKNLIVGPQKVEAIPLEPGVINLKIEKDMWEPEIEYYIYDYKQPFDVGGIKLNLIWRIVFQINAGVPEEGVKTFDDWFLDRKLNMRGEFEPVQSPRDVIFFGSCSYKTLPLYKSTALLENGDKIEFFYHLLRPLAGTGPANIIRAEVTIGSEYLSIDDYWHLVYAAEHHNWMQEFLILFPSPVGNTYGVWIDEEPMSEKPPRPPDIYTVNLNLGKIQKLEAFEYKTERILNPEYPEFLRGDANSDGRIDMGDAIFILNYQFAGGPAPECLDSADVNDDGRLDISDSIYLFNYIFAGGPEPKPPFPEAGIDPTPDELGCGGAGR